jgi:hypothetical protein
MSIPFETVDEKIAEVEFFLQRMSDPGFKMQEFKWYFSAFLAAARTSTLALQRFRNDIPGFNEWYAPHQQRLTASELAKHFLEIRNDHAHGGDYPVSGASIGQGNVVFCFPQTKPSAKSTLNATDIVAASRSYFLELLGIVFDCYLKLGVYIDPQQYFTKENYKGGIEQAECEVHGWVCTSLIEEGFTKNDRWHELRSHVGECQINHLFYGYLGKVTPQPIIPEHYKDFAYTNVERGWHHIPAGFPSLKAYRKWFRQMKSSIGSKR